MKALRFLVVSFLLIIPAVVASANDDARLLRFPDISGDQITFVYAGDIWITSSDGGTARRLTTHEGQELFPKLSPDGRWVAFSADYSGNRQVFVVSAKGGTPRQLTFHNPVGAMPPRGGYDHRVLGWTPDGKNVLFHANRLPWSVRMSRPYLIPVEGGMEKPLGIPYGGTGSFSPDGTKYVWTPIDREFRTWKRYRGGRAQDVWIYDLEKNVTEQITDWKGTDNQPVWLGDTIYYSSDRTGTLNLYSHDVATGKVAQLTDYEYDVLWPSGKGDRMVFESGGYIYKLETANNTPTRVPIKVFGSFPATIPYFKNVSGDIESMGISPSGKRVVLGSRGDVFTVPAKDGEIRNLTASSGVREMGVSWSPDGKWIAYLSDRSGEYEIYVRPADGKGIEKRLTDNGMTWIYDPVWSPDSKMLAFSDKEQRLRVLDVTSTKISEVDSGLVNTITNFSWSHDSRWLAYEKTGENRFASIFVWSSEEGESTQLTSEMTNDTEPAFDPKGRYLYFLSDRDFNMTFSGFEFSYLYTNPTRVYVATLQNDGPALFLPKSDEEEASEEQSDVKSDEKSDKSAPDMAIDFEGFEARVRAFPTGSGTYGSLGATPDGPLYVRDGKLSLYNIAEEKEEVVLDGATAYALTAKGDKLVYRKGSAYGIADAKAGQSGTPLNLSKLEMKIVPKEEWAQIFTDGWRLTKYWFYDPEMHGLDWNAMREKYGALVPHVSHRADLDFIFGELAGELNVGHTYVEWGDFFAPKRRHGGLLGAEIERDESGYFRVAKIFPGENWHDAFRSPLTEPGVDVRKGDLIIEVDGVSTKGVDNFYRLLENKGGSSVALLVNSTPETKGARLERVRTVTAETNLRFLDWVQSRREYVDKLSNGKIGYIYLPNTGGAGNRELFKYFYPQARKESLIIDARYNGGGFIPGRMIELLDRPILSFWARRGLEPTQTPGFAHVGPKAVLINGYSASGGDAFPYYFRKRNLGKVIGKRTWGGLVGIAGNPTFVDGATIRVPVFRFYDTDGMWAVENHGVEPDIEVYDRPEALAAGEDPTLKKAIEVLLEELETNSPKRASPPSPPDESN